MDAKIGESVSDNVNNATLDLQLAFHAEQPGPQHDAAELVENLPPDDDVGHTGLMQQPERVALWSDRNSPMTDAEARAMLRQLLKEVRAEIDRRRRSKD